MWNFLNDLADGKEFEHRMLEIAAKEFPSEKWESNKLIKWVDIISSNGSSIEAKYDRMSSKTWNLFIEVECNGKPSWINAYQDLSIYAYGTEKELFLFNPERLKRGLLSPAFRRIKWWDWWRSLWILLPIRVAKQLASKTISIW